MKAFSYLCKKIKISLMYDTLTLYPSGEDLHFSDAIECVETNRALYVPSEVQYKKNVFRTDVIHALYHQDDFNPELTHYHLRFNKPMDELTFTQIMYAFAAHHIISNDEKIGLLNAFHQASSMPKPQIIYSNREWVTKARLLHLKLKAIEFSKKALTEPQKYTLAADTSRQLYKQLNKELKKYCANRSSAAYTEFKNNCEKAITTSRPVLEQHRGMNAILGNILLAIAMVGVGYVIAGCVNLYRNNKFLLYPFKTDAAEKLDALSDSLRLIPAPV